MSVAGALEKEGLVPTFFVWPGPGKVAYAPELPLSDVARARGERDVSICGEAFASAMVSARKGLTREAIVELDADCLTGEAAVTARLADGVATYEEVLTMALAQAGAGDNAMAIESETPDPKSPADMAARAEGDEPDGDEADGGMKPSPDCANCGMRNADTAKFCNQCGESMAAPPMKGDDPPADPPADAPAKPGAPPPPKPPAPDSARSASTVATMLGLPANASAPAVKTALVPFLALADKAMKLTDTRSPRQAMGALQTLADDAGETGDLRVKLGAAEKREAWDKRMALCRKLAAADLPGYPRGDILADRVSADGKSRTVVPSKVYAEMNLDTLDGLVSSKLASRAPGAPDVAKRNPFQPPPAPKETAPGSATVTDSDRATAIKFGLDPERVAASRHAIQMQNVTSPHATHGA